MEQLTKKQERALDKMIKAIIVNSHSSPDGNPLMTFLPTTQC
jgi:hypothetical protein